MTATPNIQREYTMSRSDNVFFAKRNLVDTIWKEAHLEGITATFPQTKEVFEGRAVSGLTVDETIAINNLKKGWAFVLDNLDADIDLAFVRQVNFLVGEGLMAGPGELRMVDVSIGGTNWKPAMPDYEKAKDDIAALAANGRSTRGALEMFVSLCRMQLFHDANKRTAQLVANAMLISSGHGILAVPIEQLPNWEELLIGYYETGDQDALVKFLAEQAVAGYDSRPDEYRALAGKAPSRYQMPSFDKGDPSAPSSETVEQSIDRALSSSQSQQGERRAKDQSPIQPHRQDVSP